MKPFFLPLMKKYYLQFAEGTKKTEYRMEKGMYNKNQLFVGRNILISNGYSKKDRLNGVITRVYRSKRAARRSDFIAIYGVQEYAFCFDIELS